MLDVYRMTRKVAPTAATVLLTGETGTGKELIARALHELSPRATGPFIRVNCGALSESLLESELFGHEKGAFTGAFERRIGRFEQASGGTIFLDEIGEIDSTTQVKLLRVLGEERSFERVGGNTPIRADIRLVAATNKDLAKLVSEGKFRDDLFFRLSVVPLTMPPLRARLEDVPMLVRSFLKTFSEENRKPVSELTADAMQALLRYEWPGNVRELRTAIEHGVVMASGAKVTLRDLPAAIRQNSALNAPSKTTLDAEKKFDLHLNEHQLIEKALQETGGNITKAALRLGISRRTLHRKLHEIRQPAPPQSPEGHVDGK